MDRDDEGDEDDNIEFEEELGGGVPLPDCIPRGVKGNGGGCLEGPGDGSGAWGVDGRDGGEGGGDDGGGGLVVSEVWQERELASVMKSSRMHSIPLSAIFAKPRIILQ